MLISGIDKINRFYIKTEKVVIPTTYFLIINLKSNTMKNTLQMYIRIT